MVKRMTCKVGIWGLFSITCKSSLDITLSLIAQLSVNCPEHSKIPFNIFPISPWLWISPALSTGSLSPVEPTSAALDPEGKNRAPHRRLITLVLHRERYFKRISGRKCLQGSCGGISRQQYFVALTSVLQTVPRHIFPRISSQIGNKPAFCSMCSLKWPRHELGVPSTTWYGESCLLTRNIYIDLHHMIRLIIS